MPKVASFRISGILVLSAALAASGCGKNPKPDLPSIESRIRKLLEMPTVEYVYKDIVYLGDKKTFLFFTTVDKKLLFSLNLRVRAGVGLGNEGIRLAVDEKNPKRISVRLPKPAVLLVDADERSIHQYFAVEKGGRFGRLEYSREIEKIKPRIEKDAKDRGILRHSEDNARRIVRSFLELAGFEEVDFGQPTKG